MITDQETNFVYFSDLLPKRHPVFSKELTVMLTRKGIKYGLLPDTNDIWCRDYMPIPIAENSFVQFKYDPIYLQAKKYRKTITDTSKVCKSIGIKPIVSDIKIDGGNVVKSRTKVVMTDRIFKENPGYTEETLLKKIRDLLKVKEVIVIPRCPGDPFGHADGMIRFVDGIADEETILVSDFSKEHPAFYAQFNQALARAGLRPVILPYTAWRNKGDNAKGIYINYLQVSKTVFYPVYGIKEDEQAQEVFKRCFGNNIVPISANAIAKGGGVLNCASWNIRR